MTLVDDDEDQYNDFVYGSKFGIKSNKKVSLRKDADIRVRESDKYRTSTIALAIRYNDLEALDSLKSLEIPPMRTISFYESDLDYTDYYNEDLFYEISKANDEILDYFSNEVEVESRLSGKNSFMFYGLGEVLDKLVLREHNHLEKMLDKAIDHNKETYETIKKMSEESTELILKRTDEGTGMLSYYFAKDIDYKGIITNVIQVCEESENPRIQEKIDKLNDYFDKAIFFEK